MAGNQAERTATGMSTLIQISLMLRHDMAALDLITSGVRGVSARSRWLATYAPKYVSRTLRS